MHRRVVQQAANRRLGNANAPNAEQNQEAINNDHYRDKHNLPFILGSSGLLLTIAGAFVTVPWLAISFFVVGGLLLTGGIGFGVYQYIKYRRENARIERMNQREEQAFERRANDRALEARNLHAELLTDSEELSEVLESADEEAMISEERSAPAVLMVANQGAGRLFQRPTQREPEAARRNADPQLRRLTR